MPKLTYLPTGQSFEVPAGTRYVDFCGKEDLPQPFGCTVGSCGTCVVALESGAANVDPASADERDTIEMATAVAGARLGCQLVIRGDVALRPIE
jgi:ferredoxin